MGRPKVNYFQWFFLIGPSKLVRPLELGNFPTPARPAHSRALKAFTHSRILPAQATAFPPLPPPVSRCLLWQTTHHPAGGSSGWPRLLWSPPPPGPAFDALPDHPRPPHYSASTGLRPTGPNAADHRPTQPRTPLAHRCSARPWTTPARARPASDSPDVAGHRPARLGSASSTPLALAAPIPLPRADATAPAALLNTAGPGCPRRRSRPLLLLL
jgi:hypothetical protein